MRKLSLISALLLASVSAHAGESRGLVLASGDASFKSDIAAPLPPIKKSEQTKEEVKQESKQYAAVPARLPSKSAHHVQAGRYAAHEAKARRIAAKYGIYW
jgi:hypothetical protein